MVIFVSTFTVVWFMNERIGINGYVSEWLIDIDGWDHMVLVPLTDSRRIWRDERDRLLEARDGEVLVRIAS